MNTKAVIGLGYGDEGKGVTTEYLCSQSPNNTLVVRFSGGQQCGHKVMKGKIAHIFANFGAGTLSGCPTYWSEFCTFEPVGFMREYNLLKSKGITPKVILHSACAITTPFDIYVNEHGDERQHGTTGTGFYRTKKRHFEDKVQFTIKDIVKGDTALRILDVWKYYALAHNPEIKEFTDACSKVRYLMMKRLIYIDDESPVDLGFENVVFEGSQGLLLDPKIGTMPHCTPSDLTPNNIYKMGFKLDEVYMVTRAYQTRHGNGPMTNTEYPISLSNNEEEMNVPNPYQGVFRTSVLDLDQLIHAKQRGIDQVIQSDTRTNLVMTCGDQVFPYQATLKGKMYTFQSLGVFAGFVSDVLRINGRVYVNDSPYSSSMRDLKD